MNGDENENNNMEGTRSLDDYSRFRNFESYSQKLEDYIPPECGVTHWSDFSPCIGPCGGMGQRQSMLFLILSVRKIKFLNYRRTQGVELQSGVWRQAAK